MEPVNVGTPWTITRTNANVAGAFELLAAPSRAVSHHIKTMTIVGGSASDGFRLLRRACPQLTAANNTITITDAATLQMATGDFSLELWFCWKSGTVAAVAGFFSKVSTTEGYKIEITSAGLVKATFGDSDESVNLSSVTPVTDGHWHHIAVTVDRDVKAGFVLYVDAVAVATSTDAAADPTDIESNVTASGTDITMTGIASVTMYVCGVGIYKGLALTAAQVAARYQKARGAANDYVVNPTGGTGKKFTGSETSLSCGLNLDEGVGAACYDTTVNANAAALSNTTWAEDGLPLGLPILQTTPEFPAVGNLESVPFDPPLEIGRGNPIRTLETNGSFQIMLSGETR